MNPYRKYTMTAEDLGIIKRASRPARYMVMAGKEPPSPQENANAAWRALGENMGFDYMTVRPSGPDQRDFIARPI